MLFPKKKMEFRPIAIAGMGAVGRALAEKLTTHRSPILAYNRSAERFAALPAGTNKYIWPATDPSELLGSRIVFCCLLDYEAIVATITPEALSSDAIFVCCSTVTPAESIKLSERFPNYVEATILGTPPLLRTGSARFYIAANDPDARSAVEHVLNNDYECVVFDQLPKGTMMKAALQTYNMFFLMGVFHYNAFAKSMGFTAQEIDQSVTNMPYWPTYGHLLNKQIADGPETDVRVSCNVATKSLTHLQALGETYGINVSVMHAVLQEYQEAAARNPTADITTIASHLCKKQD